MLRAISYFQFQTGAEIPPWPRVTETSHEGAHGEPPLQEEILQQAQSKAAVCPGNARIMQDLSAGNRDSPKSGAW